jgi:hypothetical protein
MTSERAKALCLDLVQASVTAFRTGDRTAS